MALLPRRGSVHVRAIIEMIDDARCDTFSDKYNRENNTDHTQCMVMAASWPIPGPYDDLNDQ